MLVLNSINVVKLHLRSELKKKDGVKQTKLAKIKHLPVGFQSSSSSVSTGFGVPFGDDNHSM